MNILALNFNRTFKIAHSVSVLLMDVAFDSIRVKRAKKNLGKNRPLPP